MKDLSRPHYVYRFYDDCARLLYVGCSMDPLKRWEQHAGREFWPYVTHADVRGPWERKVALAIESEAIEAEYPFFNCRRAYDRARRDHNAAVSQAMVRDGWGARPDYDDETTWDAWFDAEDQYREQLRATVPPMDERDRLDLYLRSLAAGAAA